METTREDLISKLERAVEDRILAIAAMKSIMADAAGNLAIVKAAASRLSQAICWAEYCEMQLKEFDKTQRDTEAEAKKAEAKAKLGIGGNN